MNKNDKTTLLAKYFIFFYLYLFLGFCKCNMRNNIMIEIQEWYQRLEKCSDTKTKRQFTVFEYVNLLNPDTITIWFTNCLMLVCLF